MASEVNREDQFDNLIKDKINNHQVELRANAWEKFTRYQQLQSYKDGMDFDQTVRNKIHPNTGAMPVTGWNSFLNHWENRLIADGSAFDKNIRRKVSDVSSGLASSVFESAMRTVHNRRRLYVSKVIETSLMALLLCMTWMYNPEFENKSFEKNLNEQKTIQKSGKEPLANNASFDNQEQIASIQSDEEIIQQETYQSKSKLADRTEGKYDQRNGNLSGSKQSHYNENQRFTNSNPSDNVLADNHLLLNAEDNILSDLNLIESNNEVVQELAFNETWAGIDFLSAQDISPKSFYSPDINPEYTPIKSRKYRSNRFVSKTWIGASLGHSINQIRTPVLAADNSRAISADFVTSSILGFNLELKNNYVNVETGIGYTSLNFGDDKQRSDNIKILNIPLSLKKEFFTKNRFSPYVKLGPDLNIVVDATYFPDQSRPQLRNPQDALAPLSNYITYSEDGGVWQSGTFAENSFLGLHGSFGIEGKVAPTSKINVEFTQQINPFNKGLGINNNKLSAFSVNLGFKHLLY